MCWGSLNQRRPSSIPGRQRRPRLRPRQSAWPPPPPPPPSARQRVPGLGAPARQGRGRARRAPAHHGRASTISGHAGTRETAPATEKKGRRRWLCELLPATLPPPGSILPDLRMGAAASGGCWRALGRHGRTLASSGQALPWARASSDQAGGESCGHGKTQASSGDAGGGHAQQGMPATARIATLVGGGAPSSGDRRRRT
jgi:hypothetical protein